MRITQTFDVVYRSRLSCIRPSVRFLFIRSHLTLCDVPVVAGNTFGVLYSAPTVVMMTSAVDFI
jgi:hypothetical protein